MATRPPFSITVHARALDMQCIPCDQALSGIPGPRGATENADNEIRVICICLDGA
jgi:hypothetical protein